MPELPEVETIRRGLGKSILHKRISGVEIVNKKAVRGNAADFVKSVKGERIEDVGRVGKLLMFRLSSSSYMLAHMKMTGQLIYRFDHKIVAGGHNLPHFTDKDLPTKYTWVIWTFSDGSKLYFNDMRKFGYLQIAGAAEQAKIFSGYGIEPLTKNFTLDRFREVLDKRKAPVKAILMNQKLIAGIGNIYADEICFEAKIMPGRPAFKLAAAEVAALHKATEKILREAVECGGTTFSDYVNAHGGKGGYVDYLKVYRREKMKCVRCKKGIIQKKRIGGRESRFCPVCQK